MQKPGQKRGSGNLQNDRTSPGGYLVLRLDTMIVTSTWVLAWNVPLAVEEEEDKFARSTKIFQKLVYFEPNLGSFYGFTGKLCSLCGWVLNFL